MNFIYAKDHPLLRCSLKDPDSPWNIFCHIKKDFVCEYELSHTCQLRLVLGIHETRDYIIEFRKAIETKDISWAEKYKDSKNYWYNLISKVILSNKLIIQEWCQCPHCIERHNKFQTVKIGD